MKYGLWCVIGTALLVAAGCEPVGELSPEFYVNADGFQGPGLYVDVRSDVADGVMTIRGSLTNRTGQGFFYEELSYEAGEFCDFVYRPGAGPMPVMRRSVSGGGSHRHEQPRRCTYLPDVLPLVGQEPMRLADGTIAILCSTPIGTTRFVDSVDLPAWEGEVESCVLDYRVAFRYYDDAANDWRFKGLTVPIEIIFDPPETDASPQEPLAQD
jgi:hypothetical protein